MTAVPRSPATLESAVAAEIAEILEAKAQPYAAIDLDWLCWSNMDGSDHSEHEILARNLASVAGNYRVAGAQRLVLAGSVENAATLEAIRAAIVAPLIVIRLTAPLTVMARRGHGSGTGGRRRRERRPDPGDGAPGSRGRGVVGRPNAA